MTTQTGARPMTEKQLQRVVETLAKTFGWLTYHTWNSMHSPAGFPDLCLVRERVVFAELKSAKGELSDAQDRWLLALQGAGAEYHLWRPADWWAGAIDEVLR